MDLFAQAGVVPTTGAGGDNPKSSRRGKTSAEEMVDKEMKDTMILVVKSCLASEQKMRTVYSIVIKVFKVPTSHVMVQGIKTAVSQVQEAMKNQPEETKEKLGPMSVHVFNSILKWAM
eukprot:8319829-Karenia_brevis.AAC.1